MEFDRLIEALNRNSKFLEKLLLKLDSLCTKEPNPKKEPDLPDGLMDNVDIKSILKISESTLYRLKRAKIIKPVRIGHRDYYSIAQFKKS